MQYTRPDLSCILTTVSQVILLHHKHHNSKESSASSATCMDSHIFPSCIPLEFMTLPPMTSIQSFPQATSTPKRYPMTLLLLQMLEKAVPPITKDTHPASNFLLLVLEVIGQPKPNHPLQPITRNQKSTPSNRP